MSAEALRKTTSPEEAERHAEGPIARAIERQTARLPSDLFLWAALGSMAASLILEITGKERQGRLAGQWAVPFLILGLYNKIVKVAGSDRIERTSG